MKALLLKIRFSVCSSSSFEKQRHIQSIFSTQHENIKLNPSVDKECEQDRVKFCSDVKPGQARVFECLREHRSDLSKQCESKIFDLQVFVSFNCTALCCWQAKSVMVQRLRFFVLDFRVRALWHRSRRETTRLRPLLKALNAASPDGVYLTSCLTIILLMASSILVFKTPFTVIDRDGNRFKQECNMNTCTDCSYSFASQYCANHPVQWFLTSSFPRLS